MPLVTTLTPIVSFANVSGYIYRACWMVNFLNTAAGGLAVSNTQAAAVLAAWNTFIGATANIPVVATTLPQAALATNLALQASWGTSPAALKTACDGFSASLLAQFPEQNVPTHPCSNWGTVIQATSAGFV